MAIFSDCARAASAEEARFRVQYPNSKDRSTRVIALDSETATKLEDVAHLPWHGAHFLRHVGNSAISTDFKDLPVDADLIDLNGRKTQLSAELEGADTVVVIIKGGESGAAANAVGNSCMVRGIMTTGLVLTDDPDSDDTEFTVNALRPYMRMLVVASGDDYVTEMLSALRA